MTDNIDAYIAAPVSYFCHYSYGSQRHDASSCWQLVSANNEEEKRGKPRNLAGSPSHTLGKKGDCERLLSLFYADVTDQSTRLFFGASRWVSVSSACGVHAAVIAQQRALMRRRIRRREHCLEHMATRTRLICVGCSLTGLASFSAQQLNFLPAMTVKLFRIRRTSIPTTPPVFVVKRMLYYMYC